MTLQPADKEAGASQHATGTFQKGGKCGDRTTNRSLFCRMPKSEESRGRRLPQEVVSSLSWEVCKQWRIPGRNLIGHIQASFLGGEESRMILGASSTLSVTELGRHGERVAVGEVGSVDGM